MRRAIRTGVVLTAATMAASIGACGGAARQASRADAPPAATPVPVATRPAAVRSDSAKPTAPRPATTAPTAPAPTAPAPAPPPVAVARPADAATAVSARRAALLADSLRLGADEVGYYMDVQEARLRQLIAMGYGVARRDSGIVVTIPGLQTFDVGSARLLPTGLESLSGLAKVLVEYDKTVLTLNGYTDSSGEAQSNLALSQARTIALARHLIAAGVAARRIVAVGRGAAEPLADNTTPDGRERNRRIEVRIDPLTP